MAKSINKVTLIGNLTKDVDLRYMPNGNPVANIGLATDESYTSKDTGQKVEAVEFHRLTVYGKLAEIAQQYLKKGSKAYFEGKLKTREWEKDGVKHYTTEIVVNDMVMLDGKQQGQYQQPQQQSQYQQQPQQHHQPQQQYQPQQQPAQPPYGYPQGYQLPQGQQQNSFPSDSDNLGIPF